MVTMIENDWQFDVLAMSQPHLLAEWFDAAGIECRVPGCRKATHEQVILPQPPRPPR